MDPAILYVDGGCHQKPWTQPKDRDLIACVTDDHGTVLVDKVSRGGSNNIAELWAVLEALEWCKSMGVMAVQIKTDSRNNLAWVLGKRVGKHLNDKARVLEMKRRINELRSRLVSFQIEWVPRERNIAGHHIERKYSL